MISHPIKAQALMTTLESSENLIITLLSMALKLVANNLHVDLQIVDALGGKRGCTMVQICNLELLKIVMKEGNIERKETAHPQSKSQ